MATVTPIYGWPIPQATDLVKDGWEAIADLGDAIETTVSGLGSGLKLISNNTVTTQSTVNFQSCFSSTYTNYKVIINPTAASTNNDIYINLLSGTTAATTAYYFAYTGIEANGSGANANAQNTSYMYTGNIASAKPYNTVINMDIFGPNVAKQTTFQSQANLFTTVYFSRSGGGWHDSETAYDGFKIYTSSGTFSGTVAIYGYQK